MYKRQGTACVLFACALSYFIWRFNPEFKLPEKTRRDQAAGPTGEIPGENLDKSAGAILFIEEPLTQNKKNTLKEGQELPLIIGADDREPDIQTPYMREEPAVPVVPVSRLPKKALLEPDPLELEIKAVHDLKTHELKSPVDLVKPDAVADYEPMLDLKAYKFPPLDLLQAHGNDRIIQDPAELENNKTRLSAR